MQNTHDVKIEQHTLIKQPMGQKTNHKRKWKISDTNENEKTTYQNL